MADRIKGITIEIGGKTTKLTAALASVNKSLSASQKALRDVNKLLKFDPKSTELLRQKQEYLKKSVEDTKKKLQQEKDALAQLRASDTTGETVEQQRALERQIADTEAQLKSFESQLRSFGSVGAQQVAAVGEKFKEIGGKIEAVGQTLTKYVTTPIVGLFTASGKSALDFGDSVAKVATIMDKGQMSVADMHDQILNLSDATGKGAAEIAEATYQAISASVDTKDAIGFVETAVGLAKAGFLETADAVDVLTTIINAYGYSADDAQAIADQLVQTQNKGKTTVNELASAMGTVIQTAAALNIPLEQLNASYVALTKQGVNTANATTYLNSMFKELSDAGTDVAHILKNKTGKSFGEFMNTGGNLGEVLQILYESVDGNGEAFLNLWGNVRAGKAALAEANVGADEFVATLVGMETSSGNVASALTDLDTPAARLRKSLNKLQNAGIRLGEILLPVVDKIAEGIGKLADWWDKLDPKTQKTITTALAIAAAVGPLLVIGGKLIAGIGILMTFAPVVTGAFAGVIGPILAVVAVIGVLVAAGVWLYKNWDEIKEAAKVIWEAVKEKVASVVESIRAKWEELKAAAAAVAEAFRQKWAEIKQGVETLRSNVVQAWTNLKQGVVTRATAIWTSVTTVFENIRSTIQTKINAAKDAVHTAIEKIKGFFNFSWSLPHLKLPHFSVSGGVPPWGFGGKGSLPSISVSWYAKAMDNGMILDNPTIFGAMGGKLLGAGEAGAEAIIGVGSLRRIIHEAVNSAGTGVRDIYMTVNAAPGQDERAIASMALSMLQDQIMRRARA